MAERKYFSLPAAAREVGVSPDLLRRHYKSGLIPAIKTPGGQPRFSAETIEAIKQNGWPKAPDYENEIDQAEEHPSQEARQSNSASYFPVRVIRVNDQADPKFTRIRSTTAPHNLQLDQPAKRATVVHVHQQWIDNARLSLPYWLTPAQKAEAMKQIEREIRGISEDDLLALSKCTNIVKAAIEPFERERRETQVRESVLNSILLKVPANATDIERNEIQTLARKTVRQCQRSDLKALFADTLGTVAPLFAAIELRQCREKMRVWALQRLPQHANEKEQRQFRAAISKVIEQIGSKQGETEVRDKLEDAIEPVLIGIQNRIDEENRGKRVASLLRLAELHVNSYLNSLYSKKEIDYAAIADWEWRREVEGIVNARLKETLRGNETDEELENLVEGIVDGELNDPDDDE